MKKLSILAPLVLAGCVHSAPLTLSDGSQGYRVECNGSVFSIADCYEEAGKICGAKGYNVYGGGSDSSQISMANGSMSANQFNAAGSFSASSSTVINRAIIFGCKP